MKPARVVRLFAVTLLALAAGACTHPGPGPGHPPGTPPTTTPPRPTALVEWTREGGLCLPMTCNHSARINSDGSWTKIDGDVATAGTLDPAATAELTRRIQTQVGTLSTLERHSNGCAAAYDGQDDTYTFHAGRRDVKVSTCEFVIPGDNALLLYTAKVIAGLRQGPPPTGKLLVEYHESGGHCRETCPEQTATIGTDGAWSATSGPTATNGQLSPAATAELSRRVTAEVRTLSALGPSNGCPSAYDGRDIEFTFHVQGRDVKVSNCTKDFGDNALLAYVGGIIEGFF
jgi:hypothetical protein